MADPRRRAAAMGCASSHAGVLQRRSSSGGPSATGLQGSLQGPQGLRPAQLVASASPDVATALHVQDGGCSGGLSAQPCVFVEGARAGLPKGMGIREPLLPGRQRASKWPPPAQVSEQGKLNNARLLRRAGSSVLGRRGWARDQGRWSTKGNERGDAEQQTASQPNMAGAWPKREQIARAPPREQ